MTRTQPGPRPRSGRARSILAVAVLACAAAAAVVIPAVAHAAMTAQVAGVGSAHCVDVPGTHETNGVQIQLWDCNGGPNQQVTLRASGELTLLGRCLDTDGSARTEGAKVVLWACTGGATQRWKLDGDRILGADSGLCLDAFRKGVVNGTPLVIWSCNGGSNQAWTIGGGSVTTPTAAMSAPGTTDPPSSTSAASTGPSSAGQTSTARPVGANLGVHDPSRITQENGSSSFSGTGGVSPVQHARQGPEVEARPPPTRVPVPDHRPDHQPDAEPVITRPPPGRPGQRGPAGFHGQARRDRPGPVLRRAWGHGDDFRLRVHAGHRWAASPG